MTATAREKRYPKSETMAKIRTVIGAEDIIVETRHTGPNLSAAAEQVAQHMGLSALYVKSLLKEMLADPGPEGLYWDDEDVNED